MTYLLDTHALVWALVSPERLSAAAREAVEDTSNEVWVSAASGWEIATKVRLGRWPEARPLTDALPRFVRRLRAAELPVSLEDGVLAGQMEWEHRDPFDRMLVAQALARGLRIVTRDAAITDHAVSTLW